MNSKNRDEKVEKIEKVKKAEENEKIEGSNSSLNYSSNYSPKSFFVKYLKEKRGVASLFVLFALIFAAVFYFYSLPLGAVLYPAALCLVLSLFVIAADCRRKFAVYRELCKIKDAEDVFARLPFEAPTCESGELCRIINLLAEYEKELSDSFDSKYRDMKEYYTMWAHQIKTPISSMRLRLSDDAFSDGCRALSGDLARIEHYVEMALVYMRLDSDSTDYVIKEVDLDFVIRQAVKRFAGEFILKKLSLEYSGCTLKAVTDEKWISFVIGQLISNALKYTKSGKITISVTGNVLSVKDTGIGAAREDLPRIFEKGYTGLNGRYDKSASGIGLYLCRRVCDALGHRIYADSRVGEGFEICVDFTRESAVCE